MQYQLKTEYRHNSYNAETGTVTVSDRRAKAIAQTAEHYEKLYGSAPALHELRDDYAMKEDTLPDPKCREDLTKFFFLDCVGSSNRALRQPCGLYQ